MATKTSAKTGTKASGKTSEKELLDLENRYWQAIKNKDVDAAMKLTDDPCIVTGAQGVGTIPRKAFAGMLTSTSWTLNDFQLTDVQTRFVNNDVAIVAYKVREQLTTDAGRRRRVDVGTARRPLALRAAHRVRRRRSLWTRSTLRQVARTRTT